MSNNEYRSPKIIPLSEDPTIKKSHPFALFMGIWFSFLILAIVLFVGKFYQYLQSYEAEYQASLPHHVPEEIVGIIQEGDMASIYEMMTEKPEISEFETEENLYRYMFTLVNNKQISYAKTSDYAEDSPEYYLTADRYIVGKMHLKKSATEERKYKLPKWDVDQFEFYTDAQHSVRISCPSTYSLEINGVKASQSYCYKSEKAPGQDYFTDIELPDINTYYVEGLYEEAEVKAVRADGYFITPAMNYDLGMYQVLFSTSSEIQDEMLAFMEKAAITYTHYVSNDASREAASQYFTGAATQMLQMVEYGETRRYYPWHRIQSEETKVIEFNPYDENHFYCQLNIEQVLLLYGTQEKNVTTECRFYCIRTANGWKVCGVQY
jgi:hypothetical protein